MKKVLVSIRNGLLSTAVIRALNDSGEFLPYRIPTEVHANISESCETEDADILLVEMSYLPGSTVDARLKEIRQVRRKNPGCKIAVFCDDNAAPEIAHQVIQLKKDCRIDSFFYTSVTENYFMSTLAVL